MYPSVVPTVQPVKKSAMFAGVFFLLASLLEFVSLYTRYSLHLSLNQPQCSPSLHRCIAFIAGNQFCANCGQQMITQQPDPKPQASTTFQPQSGAAQVRYADESMKKWEMRLGEQSMRSRHEIVMLQPNGGKFGYHMEVTNQRILFYRESSTSKNAVMVARMGGGLVGSLIAEEVKAASGAGPKPWLEITLTTVSNCRLQNKKGFFIVADQTYVLKNKNYDTLLPNLVAQAKVKGI